MVAADFLLLLGLATLVGWDLAALFIGLVAFDDAFLLGKFSALAFEDPSLLIWQLSMPFFIRRFGSGTCRWHFHCNSRWSCNGFVG